MAARVVLVTGGAGFVGSAVVRALLERGDAVRVLDDLSTGSRANLEQVADDVELVEGDLRDARAVEAAVRGAETIFHLGALPSVPRSLEDPETTYAVNATGTANVLAAATTARAGRVVLASSSSVYGNEGSLPRREDMTPAPLSPYAESKLQAERLCERAQGVETVVLRFFNVFGPRQDPRSRYAAVVPRFLAAVAAGEPVTIYGDGRQSRDFTFVADVANAVTLAGDAAHAPGRVLNVAAGRTVTVDELATSVARVLGRPLERSHEPPRAGDVRASWADIGAAREVLGYEPRVSLEDGLRAAADWMLAGSPSRTTT